VNPEILLQKQNLLPFSDFSFRIDQPILLFLRLGKNAEQNKKYF
jgi:hypothetical protein